MLINTTADEYGRVFIPFEKSFWYFNAQYNPIANVSSAIHPSPNKLIFCWSVFVLLFSARLIALSIKQFISAKCFSPLNRLFTTFFASNTISFSLSPLRENTILFII